MARQKDSSRTQAVEDLLNFGNDENVNDNDDLLSGLTLTASKANTPPPNPPRMSIIDAKPPVPPRQSSSRLDNLYNDNKVRQQKLEKKRQELLEKEKRGMFQPKVRRSKRLEAKVLKQQQRGESSSSVDGDLHQTPMKDGSSAASNTCHNRLYQNAMTSNEKKEQSTLNYVQDELKTHTFKPKLFTANSPVNKRVNVRLNEGKKR